MNTIIKNLMMILISVIMIIPASTMIMPVSASYHSSNAGAVTYGLNYDSPYSWIEPWVGVPRYLCGSWEVHGNVYSSREATYYYQATGSTNYSPWRTMRGWTYSKPYLSGYAMHGGWYG